MAMAEWLLSAGSERRANLRNPSGMSTQQFGKASPSLSPAWNYGLGPLGYPELNAKPLPVRKSETKRKTDEEEEGGGWGRDRTADTAIFSRMLYQLSYPAAPRSANQTRGHPSLARRFSKIFRAHRVSSYFGSWLARNSSGVTVETTPSFGTSTLAIQSSAFRNTLRKFSSPQFLW